MGTSDFSLKALIALRNDGFKIAAVYTREPKPSGRNYRIHKSPVHEFAEKEKIPVFCPKSFKSEEETKLFESLRPDLAVVSSYGLIIPQKILNIPPYGFINIHASLLPRWRGAAPVQSAILAGDKETGITIMKMDAGIDSGDIILAESIEISPETTGGELSERLGDLGARMISEVLNDFDNSLSKSRKQPEEGVSYAKKITDESCQIDWNNSAENILRQIKAFSPVPAARSKVCGLCLQILDAEKAEGLRQTTPGLISEGMIVACGIGALKLRTVRPAGKNQMSGEAFLRGRRELIGKVTG
jgi:methionyl-tRNA formyltransferase